MVAHGALAAPHVALSAAAATHPAGVFVPVHGGATWTHAHPSSAMPLQSSSMLFPHTSGMGAPCLHAGTLPAMHAGTDCMQRPTPHEIIPSDSSVLMSQSSSIALHA